MCGIAGILRTTQPGEAAKIALTATLTEAIPEAWLDLLDASIRHRGPDGQGRFRDRIVHPDGTVVDVAFVHRRLSIIDRGGGAQPMVSQRGPGASLGSASGVPFHPLLFHGTPNDPVHYQPLADHADTLAVVFNGCIYNHRELRAELQKLGHAFSTDHSDTEVLLHGWRQWKGALTAKIEGMYAAALWDRASGDLILLRDGFGEKPLYTVSLKSDEYSEDFIAFSSCPVGLMRLLTELRGRPPRVERPQLAGWVKYGWGQTSPVASLSQVLAGLGKQVQSGPMDHWEFEDELPGSYLQPQGPAAGAFGPRKGRPSPGTVEDALKAAVRSRLEADVPVGVFLSGGIDSALVAKFASEAQPSIEAFTVRMPAREYDESEAAAETAAALSVRHHVLDCDPRPAEDLVALIEQLGLPFGDSSLLPALWVSRAARSHVSVALSGDGGDELFLGYERHAVMGLIGWLRQRSPWVRRLTPLLLGGAHPKSRRSKLRRLLAAAGSGGYKELLAVFPAPLDEHVGIRGPLGFFDSAHHGMCIPTESVDDQVMQALRLDLCFYLPEDLLRKSDTASMSVALEVRAPFLDRRLAEIATSAAVDVLMPRGQRKGLLRAVARRHLPAHIVDRPKMGFAIPIGEWFRTDYGGLRTLLLDHMNSTEPFGLPSLGIDLNMAYVRQMLDEHLGTGKSGLVTRDHSQRLYMLLVLSIWAKWLGALRAE